MVELVIYMWFMLVLANISFFCNSILSIYDLNHISKACYLQNSPWEIKAVSLFLQKRVAWLLQKPCVTCNHRTFVSCNYLLRTSCLWSWTIFQHNVPKAMEMDYFFRLGSLYIVCIFPVLFSYSPYPYGVYFFVYGLTIVNRFYEPT